ncbi:MAG: hypothetical protein KatS3mg027_0299 [Bacteroidia bacterium]|nr:MAG: hypothetical protein KatS3mg027_0299 [Bacteroidia bacterium]
MMNISVEIASDALHPRNDGLIHYSYKYPFTCGKGEKIIPKRSSK